MGILVWGLGRYFRQKEKSIPETSILAFVSGRESGVYRGIRIIRPTDIFQYEYDRLYVMTGLKAMFEILSELKALGYEAWDKIVLGCNMKPFTEDEEILFVDGRMKCDSGGICRYMTRDQIRPVRNEAEWRRLRQEKIRNRNRNILSDIPLDPISRVFGMDRGLPIDRYYIEGFLDKNASHIKGTVLEVAGQEYTKKFGTDIDRNFIIHVSDTVGENGIIANLETGEGVIDELADCFILTQTLSFIFDAGAAARNAVRFLKKGGVALVTVSGISQISRYDMDRWGHYWSFTTASLRKIFEACSEVESVETEAYGNVKSAVYGLYGLAAEDINKKDMTYHDGDYQQIVTAVVRKK